jgi:hypothetical protein
VELATELIRPELALDNPIIILLSKGATVCTREKIKAITGDEN